MEFARRTHRLMWIAAVGWIAAALFGPRAVAGTTVHTEYPLFTVSGQLLKWQPDDLAVLTSACIFAHGRFEPEDRKAAREMNPDFIFLTYINRAKVYLPAPAAELGADWLRDLLYYRAGVLAQAVDAQATTLRLEQADGPIALRASVKPLGQASGYDVWLRMGEELMRVEAWDKQTGQATVSRGFAGTKPEAHAASDGAFTPILSQRESLGGRGEGGPRYIFDPAGVTRWKLTLQDSLEAVEAGADGVWLDLVSSDPLRPATATGALAAAWWDFEQEKPYTPDRFREASEWGLNYLQNEYRKAKGQWPIVYANNMGKISDYDIGSGGRAEFLRSTQIKPRPLDGYCIEGFAGMVGGSAEFFTGGARRGGASPVRKTGYESWREKTALLARAAQEGLAACPMICNAGVATQTFERATQAQKDDFESWAYASYLLCVERKDGRCPTPLGVPFMRWEGDTRRVALHPRYSWPVGDPAETKPWDKLDEYCPAGHATYVRHFAHGVALVNPTSEADSGVPLGRDYTDPESGETMQAVDMPAQTGRILLAPDAPTA